MTILKKTFFITLLAFGLVFSVGVGNSSGNDFFIQDLGEKHK